MVDIKDVPIKAIKERKGHRKDMGDIEGLWASIERVGLLHPIILGPSSQLIVGARRLRAYKDAGKTHIPARVIATFKDLSLCLQAERDENCIRKDFLPTEAVTLAADIEEHERKVAKTRQQLSEGRGKKRCGNLPHLNTGKTRDKAAKVVGMSGKTYEKAKAVIQAAKDDPKEYGDLPDEMDKKGKVDGAFKKLAHRQAKKEVADQRKQTGFGAVVYHCDYSDLVCGGEQADLLLTDPPYSTDIANIHEFAEQWISDVLCHLSSRARAYIFIGPYPDELLAYLHAMKNHEKLLNENEDDEHISRVRLQQILIWGYNNTMGPKPSYDYKNNSQFILYLRGDEAERLNCPLLTEQLSVQMIGAPRGEAAGHVHKWQKPAKLAEQFIRHSTRPGDLVIDPFAGSGTFLIEAAKLGRRAIGCDTDPEAIKLCVAAGVTAK